MNKYCLHIIKGGRCKDGIATVFELFVNNSKRSNHIILTILPIRYQANFSKDLDIHTLLTVRLDRLFILFRSLWKLSRSNNLVIKTWGHASAFLSKYIRLFLSAPIVWSIHDSGPGSQKLVSLLVKLNCKDSYTVPFSIVCASKESWYAYKDFFNYDQKKLKYIANGIDPRKFYPTSNSADFRQSLNIPEAIPVIGMVSRYCVEKGVNIFIESMQKILVKLPNALFVFCGFRMDLQNKKLLEKLEEHGILQNSILLGQRSDMLAIYGILDVLVLPSLREAQSCCLIEAMSCGVVCVSTNVGDSKIILGNYGRLVQQNDPNAISNACLSFLEQSQEEKDKLKTEGREWVVKTFDLQTFVDNYDSVLEI